MGLGWSPKRDANGENALYILFKVDLSEKVCVKNSDFEVHVTAVVQSGLTQ